MKAKLVVPKHLSEIKLWQYQKFLKLQENNTDENFLSIKLIEIFCEVDYEDVRKIKLKDVRKVANHLITLFPSHDRRPISTYSPILIASKFGIKP